MCLYVIIKFAEDCILHKLLGTSILIIENKTVKTDEGILIKII